MGSHWALFLLYLNIVLSWPEDGRLPPKHVAKYNLIVIIVLMYIVYWRYMIYYAQDVGWDPQSVWTSLYLPRVEPPNRVAIKPILYIDYALPTVPA